MRRCVYKKIHYLTLTLRSRSHKILPSALYINHVTYAPTEFNVTTSKGLGGDAFTRKFKYLTFDLGVKVTRNIAQYPLHHVTYSATKFEVVTSNG